MPARKKYTILQIYIYYINQTRVSNINICISFYLWRARQIHAIKILFQLNLQLKHKHICISFTSQSGSKVCVFSYTDIGAPERQPKTAATVQPKRFTELTYIYNVYQQLCMSNYRSSRAIWLMDYVKKEKKNVFAMFESMRPLLSVLSACVWTNEEHARNGIRWI